MNALKQKFGLPVTMALVLIIALTLVPLAKVLADNIQNDIDSTPPNSVTLVAGGSSATVGFWIHSINGNDGDAGCNIDANIDANIDNIEKLTIGIITPTGVSASPNKLTFTGCGILQNVALSAGANAVSGEVSVSILSNNTGGGSYNVNPAKFSVTVTQPVISTDTTPPAIGYVLNPAAPDGANDWYTGDVTLTWTVTDNESAVSKIGCVDQNITTDQAATTYSCSASSSGGSTAPVEVTIKRDASHPTNVVLTATGQEGSNGWFVDDVTITTTGEDSLSGIASCTPQAQQADETTGEVFNGSCTNGAGLSSPGEPLTVKLDKTGPSAVLTADGTLNNGWYTSDVVINTTGTDTISNPTTCTETQYQTGDTTGAAFSGECTNDAGLQANAAPLTIKRDVTPPTIVASLDRLPSSITGWYNLATGAPTVSFVCNDATSGVAGTCPDALTFGEGSDQAHSAIILDNAGNSASDGVSGIDVDLTLPAVAVTGVSNTAYILGSVPPAGCSTSDTLSGVANEATLSSTGGPVGSITATCSGALDNAGNNNSASVTYSVIYNWSGFFRPVDNLPILNQVKAGSAIPIKFNLGGNQGLGIFSSGYPRYISIPCSETAVVDTIEETVTAGGSGLTYDSIANQYVYVWKTDKSLAGTCRQLQVKLIDGTEHMANFKFMK